MGLGKGEDGEAFGEILLGPGGELGLAFAVGFHEVFEAIIGMGSIIGVENNFDVRGDFAFEVLLGDVFLGVLLEVELASLPGSGVQRGFESRLQAAVGI